jgi:hypothetical protein
MINIKIKWFMLLLGSFLFLGTSFQAIETEKPHESNPSEHSMNISKKIPPIDIAAPPKFKTASFGLG